MKSAKSRKFAGQKIYFFNSENNRIVGGEVGTDKEAAD